MDPRFAIIDNYVTVIHVKCNTGMYVSGICKIYSLFIMYFNMTAL